MTLGRPERCLLASGTAIALTGLAGLTVGGRAADCGRAGAADSVSALCRNTINQTVTPDRPRGRMSSVYSLVVSGGPRLGDQWIGERAASSASAA